MGIRCDKMTVIELNRKMNTLKTAKTADAIKMLDHVTKTFHVTHVKKDGNSGWYDIFNGESMIGFVTDVTEVKEKWSSRY